MSGKKYGKKKTPKKEQLSPRVKQSRAEASLSKQLDEDDGIKIYADTEQKFSCDKKEELMPTIDKVADFLKNQHGKEPCEDFDNWLNFHPSCNFIELTDLEGNQPTAVQVKIKKNGTGYQVPDKYEKTKKKLSEVQEYLEDTYIPLKDYPIINQSDIFRIVVVNGYLTLSIVDNMVQKEMDKRMKDIKTLIVEEKKKPKTSLVPEAGPSSRGRNSVSGRDLRSLLWTSQRKSSLSSEDESMGHQLGQSLVNKTEELKDTMTELHQLMAKARDIEAFLQKHSKKKPTRKSPRRHMKEDEEDEDGDEGDVDPTADKKLIEIIQRSMELTKK